MKKIIKAIVFDFDGVVVDSEPLYEATGRELFRHYGIEIRDEDWKIFRGLTAEDFFRTAIKKFNLNLKTEDIAKEDQRILKNKFRQKLKYIKGFKPFLKQIKTQCLHALVTSTSRQLLTWIFTHTGITNDFPLIITADDVTRPKPAPEPYLLVAEKLQICPGEMLVIEDSVNGVISAKQAGSEVIGFLTSFAAKDLTGADDYAKDFKELQQIIEKRYELINQI